MFALEAMLAQQFGPRLLFPLALLGLFLLQPVHFFGGRLAERFGDQVILVKVLWTTVSKPSPLIYCQVGWKGKKDSYNLAEQQHVFAAHDKHTAIDIGIDFLDKDALNRVLQNQIR
jgi:hypothetical protein